jgi:hypothetical protein
MRTPQQQNRRAALADAASGAYRSPACHIGTHVDCMQAVQRPAEVGVSFEVCSCSCHQEPGR